VYECRRAFSLFCKMLKKGGRIGICVYSSEHNFLMTQIVEPMKQVLCLLPLKLLRILAFPLALFIHALIHLVYIPLDAIGFARKMPLRDHMVFWSKSTLRFIWSACFDLLHAPISYYFTREEMIELAHSNDLVIEKLINTHGTTWSLVARKGGL
jgi:hypothetical protein